MIWKLKTSSSVLYGPPRNNWSRKWITCWTLNAAWKNRTKNCASLLCLVFVLFVFFNGFYIRLRHLLPGKWQITKVVFDFRERQDADGQMKELQDQLEAEQYFSVSICFFLNTWHGGCTNCAFTVFLLKMHAGNYCQNNILFILIS